MTDIAFTSMRHWCLGLLLCTSPAALLPAAAQDAGTTYPTKPVRLIVTYPPGNSPDAVARSVTHALSVAMGQPFTVDNRPGAGGVIGVGTAAKSAADGTTMLLADAGPILISPAVSEVPYDVNKDLVPVSLLVTSHFFLAVPASLGVSSVAELVAMAKARPGQMNYASTGPATIHHMMMETFKAEAGVNLVHVPYKGGSQAVPALISGEVMMMFSGLPAINAFARSGALKILAVASPKRTTQMPDVPTLTELGYPGVSFLGDMGVFVPAGTPAAIVNRLSAELHKAITQPDTVRSLNAFGVEPIGSSPAEANAHWKAESVKFAKAAKLAGLGRGSKND